MPGKNVVILDGTGVGDNGLLPILNQLSRVFKATDAEVVTFPLRYMKLAHCLGCFGCWVKTPGLCVEADAGRDIAKAIVRSDVTVLFTPVTFGGYSPELKKMVDRFIQLITPFFEMDHGEVHHPSRYRQRPRLMILGVQRYRTLLDAAGAPVGVQQKLMRHAQVSTTMNLYGNALMNEKRKVNTNVVRMVLKRQGESDNNGAAGFCGVEQTAAPVAISS